MKEKCYYHHANFGDAQPLSANIVCVRVHVFVSFLKRVSKLAKPILLELAQVFYTRRFRKKFWKSLQL